MLLEAFLESPVILGALGQFWKQSRAMELKLKPTSFAHFATKLQPQIIQLVIFTINRAPIPSSHEYFDCEEYTSSRPRTLRQLAIQFFCTTETWRRYALGRGFPWEFGSPKAISEAYCALLVNFVDMVVSEAFNLRTLSDMQVNEVWQRWINAYSICHLQFRDPASMDLPVGSEYSGIELPAEYRGCSAARNEEVFSGYGSSMTLKVINGTLGSFGDSESDAWTSSDNDEREEDCGWFHRAGDLTV
jgi:hypothetical protein